MRISLDHDVGPTKRTKQHGVRTNCIKEMDKLPFIFLQQLCLFPGKCSSPFLQEEHSLSCGETVLCGLGGTSLTPSQLHSLRNVTLISLIRGPKFQATEWLREQKQQKRQMRVLPSRRLHCYQERRYPCMMLKPIRNEV